MAGLRVGGASAAFGKRRLVEGDDAEAAAGAGDLDTAALMRRIKQLEGEVKGLTQEVGEGQFRQPVWKALIQHTQELERRVGELELNVYKSFEIPLESNYMKEGKKMVKLWQEACLEAKGTGKKVGSCANYVWAGFMVVLTNDEQVTKEDRDVVTKMMLERMDDGSGGLDMAQAAKLADGVGQASVATGAKCGYLNYRTQPGWEVADRALHRALLRIGKKQVDPPNPKPVSRELRKVLLDGKR